MSLRLKVISAALVSLGRLNTTLAIIVDSFPFMNKVQWFSNKYYPHLRGTARKYVITTSPTTTVTSVAAAANVIQNKDDDAAHDKSTQRCNEGAT